MYGRLGPQKIYKMLVEAYNINAAEGNLSDFSVNPLEGNRLEELIEEDKHWRQRNRLPRYAILVFRIAIIGAAGAKIFTQGWLNVTWIEALVLLLSFILFVHLAITIFLYTRHEHNYWLSYDPDFCGYSFRVFFFALICFAIDIFVQYHVLHTITMTNWKAMIPILMNPTILSLHDVIIPL